MRKNAKAHLRLPYFLVGTLVVLAAIHNLGGGAREDRAEVPQRSNAPIALPADRAQAVSLLLDARPPQPAPMLLITDPNKDPDDLTVLVLASDLQKRGFLDLRGVVATLGDRQTRQQRAGFAKAVLENLGLPDTRVAVGVDYGFEVWDADGKLNVQATEGRSKDHLEFSESPLGQPQGAVESDSLALLQTELARVPDRSAVLLVDAGMADLAALLRATPDLVRQKTARVVVMGGLDPGVDDRGFVGADERAYNNATDQPAADYVYRRIQELGIPLSVVTKEAAYAAAAPRGFYDRMAATGHPIGIYLQDQQEASLANLWAGIRGGHLPPALTPKWFFQTFTNLDPESPAGKAALARADSSPQDFHALWQQVSKLNLYDPLALLAATPGLGERLFRARTFPGAASEVRVVDEAGVQNPDLARDLTARVAVEALDNPAAPKR
jgi:inosine-uridine nucleoside N-ribohydrolase